MHTYTYYISANDSSKDSDFWRSIARISFFLHTFFSFNTMMALILNISYKQEAMRTLLHYHTTKRHFCNSKQAYLYDILSHIKSSKSMKYLP